MSEGGLLYWAEHEELGYTPGVCVAENDEVLELQCEDGEIVRMPKMKAQPVHRNSLMGVPNLLELGDYNMPALLHNVRVRYMKNDFYSSIGLPILISVNPYKSLPHLYDHKTKLQYMTAQGCTVNGNSAHPLEEVPDRKFFISKPHLFATAQMTYSALVRTKQAQSIVISGESGAGKTEATKILLKYFSELESATAAANSGNLNTPGTDQQLASNYGNATASMGDCIERYILNSNPILESFGNAKTVRNDNSSRFGRFIQIYFDLIDTHRIKCGRISHYLLEKCRLISLYEKERNFHIFYELALGGMTNPYYYKKLIEWQILPDDYTSDEPFPGCTASSGQAGFPPNPLASSGANGTSSTYTLIDHLIEDFHNILGSDPEVWYLGNENSLFEELIACMLTVGFQQDEIDNILSIIAALMHLSRVSFSPVDSPDATYTDGMPLSAIVDMEPLKTACQLLQIRNIPLIIPASIRDPVVAFSDILLFKCLRNVETGTSNNSGGSIPQWIRTPRDPTHATQIRDSIIKEVYSRLFDWIIRKINKALMNRGGSYMDYDGGGGSGGMSNIGSNKYKWSTRKQSGGLLPNLINGGAGGGSCAGLGGRNATPPIGLLDIYGFEVFEGRNSFEQLCINYANEKLQQHFNQHVLSLEQATYRKEAIDWSDILFTDNRDVIRALEEPPHGIFVILDDTRITDKNRDCLFLQEIERRGIKPIVSLPARKGTTFIVKHYAGDVQYCAQGFVEKNVDKLEAQLSYFLAKASTKALIKELFQPHDTDSANLAGSNSAIGSASVHASGATSSSAHHYSDEVMLRRNSLKATLGVEFRNQLNQLISSLTCTTPTYVRCIKPNALKKPGLFNSRDVLRQLEYAGLLESIRIRNSGFGVRSTFIEFLDDYIIILKKQYYQYRKNKQSLSSDQLKQLCVQLLMHIQPSLTAADVNGVRRWQIGRSKIFMKEEVQTVLEQARSMRRVQAASVVEAVSRGFMARKRYRHLIVAIIKVQALCRGFVARLLIKRYRAAKRLQTFWKHTLPARRWFVGVKAKVKFIQTWWRFQLYKKSLKISASRDVNNRVAKLPESEPITMGPPLTSARLASTSSAQQRSAQPPALNLKRIPSNTNNYLPNVLSTFAANPSIAPGYSEPHVSSMETMDDFHLGRNNGMPDQMARSRPRRQGFAVNEPPHVTGVSSNDYVNRKMYTQTARKYESSEDEMATLNTARKKSINKGHEFNYEATIHLMFSELTSKLRKTEKENKKMRSELTKLANEAQGRSEELAKLRNEKAALEMEMEDRERFALAQVENLSETTDALRNKLRNIWNLNQGIEAVLTDMATCASERLRTPPECDLLRDFSSYVKGCCSRGFDFLRSAMYEISIEHDVMTADACSPRCRNTPPMYMPEPSRGSGQLSGRFSRVAEDELTPQNPAAPGARNRHFHRPRRNESIYDDSSSFGPEEPSRRNAGPLNNVTQQRATLPYLRSTASAYKNRNPYMQLGGKPIDGQWSGPSPNESQFDTGEGRRYRS